MIIIRISALTIDQTVYFCSAVAAASLHSVRALNVNNNDKFNMLYSKAFTRTWPKSASAATDQPFDPFAV